ncbi:RNase P subunit p30-domain-containing protein [Tricladium varicosporioides]|nr:RNase P subunit p30-domain-containing protein [Hymenoscyphus varicosporioides]
MLYDLNVPWTPTSSPAALERTIAFLSTLGYNIIALNHTLSYTQIPSKITNPIPDQSSLKVPERTTILRRCTLTLSDPSQNYRMSYLAAAYDIFALRPLNEDAFKAACLTLTEHSIISLDLTTRFQFHFKPKTLMTAVNRGVRFEICYAQATMGDSIARRNIISNIMGIIRATKGRGLVVSSEAGTAVACRGPADVLNLLGVWGLGRERGLEAMDVNARGLVVNEGIKRSGFRGMVDVVYGGEKPAEIVTTKEKEDMGKENGAGKKGKGKRPAEETPTEITNTPPLSKRKAKKLRLEALKAAKESSPLSTTETGTSSKSSSTPLSIEISIASTIKAKANG